MKIIIELDKCIGCGTCETVCPKFFEIKDDNKSYLKKGKTAGNKSELEIRDIGCVKEAQQGCPTKCIHIK